MAEENPDTPLSRLITRRQFVATLGTAGGAFLLSGAGCSRKGDTQVPCSQVAGKNVRWLVPFPPGGGYDIYSRLLEPFFQKKTGAEMVIENMPGAGGVISATRLRDSAPDGLTLGILNAPGLLVASMTGTANVPNPAQDFTILGSMGRSPAVWLTAGDSPLRTVEDVFRESAKREIVFGISEVGSTNFVNIAVATNLLGVNAKYLSGFSGSRDVSLAAMRGEVDLITLTYESTLDRIEAGDLKPLMQFSAKRISPHRSLDDAATLCGQEGVAARRAAELGRDTRQAEEQAAALVRLTGSGVLVAAPPGLGEELSRCLERSLYEILTDSEFQAAAAKARRSVEARTSDEALSEIRLAATQAESFVPLVRETIRKLRE